MALRNLDNQENINVPHSKRIKISDVLERPVFGRRTVLGNLNTSNVRIQPKRAAKQGVKYEKVFPRFNQEEKTFSSSSSSSSGFTIYNDSLSTAPTSISSSFNNNSKVILSRLPTTFSIQSNNSVLSSSINSNKAVLLPPSSFTTSNTSESNESSYLSSLATLPPLVIPVSNSTTLSDRIKQLLKVSSSVDAKSTIACNNRSDYFKPKLALPISFAISSSNDNQKEELLTKKVSGPLAIKNLTDSVLREEIILNQRSERLWAHSLYATDVYAHLRRQEIKFRPKSSYIQKQAEITTNMRWILIDWLVEVASEYELYNQTLYLAVSYVDRFLSFMSVKRDKLQLVGTTAMFIAAKYEEIYPPESKQFAYITDNTYKVTQIIKMEQLVLRVLNFDISSPTTLEFVDNFCMISLCDEKTVHLCQFLAELSMLECETFLRYLPSMIAASALALANYTLDLPLWSQELRIRASYNLDDLKDCYLSLNRSYCRIHEYKTHAIREKYRNNCLSCVSDILPRAGYPWN